jgi:hypothetical protein
MSHVVRVLLCALASLLLTAPANAQAVIIVDIAGGPGSDATTLQGGIDLALDGDIVLVRSGNYDEFVIAGKSVTVAADSGASAGVQGFSEVSGVPAGGRVVLSGLRLIPSPTTWSTLELSNNAGAVWIDDCAFRGFSFPFGGPLPAIDIIGCDQVSISGGDFDSLAQSIGSTDGVAAVRVASSAVVIADSDLAGGDGADGGFGFIAGYAGGPGLEVNSGEVLVTGSSLSGGPGGQGSAQEVVIPCGPGGPGGPGLELGAGAPAVRLRSVTLTGGAGGPPGTGVGCNNGPPGPQQSVASGSVTPLLGPARSLDADRVLREGDPLTVTLQGAPFENTWWVVSATPAFVSDVFGGSNFLVGDPFVFFPLGPTDGTGQLVLNHTLNSLHPAIVGVTVHQQVFFTSAPGQFVGSGGRSVVLLDANVP